MRPDLRPELLPARQHAPEAAAALESAYDAASRALDPALAALMRDRVAEQLGLAVTAAATAPSDARDQACCDFADQFVVYVAAVDDDQRAGVVAVLGKENLTTLAEMIYVFDMTDRLVCALGRLFEPGPDAADNRQPSVEPRQLTAALEDLHAAAMRLHSLDAITTELVRLHCARYHDCKTWMSLRLAGARQAGLEEEGVAAAARNDLSALDERRRAALALADAFVTDPTRIDGALRADLLRHLTPAEIVEALFDVIAWSKQKVLVSLRIDAAVDADTFTPLGFDAAGKPVIG